MNIKRDDEKTLSVINYGSLITQDNVCIDEECVKGTGDFYSIKETNKGNEEEWLIKSLGNCTLSTESSELIAGLEESKRKKHEELDIIMREEMAKVTSEIEKSISNKSKLIKQYLLDSYQIIRIELDEAKLSTYKLATLDKELFATITKHIKKVSEERLQKIEGYYNQLVDLEKQRGEEFKKILRESYNRHFQICNELPFEIQKYFEQEIMKLNEITLNNHHCYVQLKKTLKLKAENEAIDWMRDIESQKHEWRKFFTILAMKKVADLKTTGLTDNEKFTLDLEQHSSVFKNIAATRQDSKCPVITKMELDDWWNNIKTTLASLDFRARELIALYKDAIIGVFNRVFDTMRCVTQHMIESGIADMTDIEHIQMEVYKPALRNLSQEYTDDIRFLQLQWGSIIKHMKSQIIETYIFLRNAANLWIDHDDRMKELKSLVKADLKNTMAENDIAATNRIRQIMTITDNIRIAHSQRELDKGLDEARKFLTKVSTFFMVCKNKESLVLKKLCQFSDTDLLIAEIKNFLVETEPNLEKQMIHKTVSRSSNTVISSEVESCKYQIKAIKNWMFGLWQSISYYVKFCKQEQSERIEDWIECKEKMLEKRAHLRCVITAARIQRIKEEMYDTRLSELKYHANRMDRHKIGVKDTIKFIETELTNYKINCEDVLQRTLAKVNEETKKLKDCENSSLMNTILLNVSKTFRLCDADAQTLHHKFMLLCEKTCKKLKLSNISFLKNIRMFSENGNYSALECKVYSKEISIIEKSIIKSFKKIYKQVETITQKIKQQVNHEQVTSIQNVESAKHEIGYMERVTRLIDELQRNLKYESATSDYSETKLDSFIKRFKDAVKQYAGKPEQATIINEEGQEVIEVLKERARFLRHSEPTDTAVCKNNTLEASLQGEFPSGIHFLFKAKPRDENCYISKMYKLIYDCYVNLQDDARKFFSTKRTTLPENLGKIQTTYKAFITELLTEYKEYQKQCEISWLECTYNFVNSVEDFQHFLFKSITQCMLDTTENSINGLKASIADEIKQIKCEQKNLQDAYMRIHNKLKPLHGHPNNKHLLEKLEEEMEQTEEDTKDYVKRLVEPTNDRLYILHEDADKRIIQVQKTLKQIIIASNFQEFINNLMLEYEEVTQILENHLGQSNHLLNLTERTTQNRDEQLQPQKLATGIKTTLKETILSLSKEFEGSLKTVSSINEDAHKIRTKLKLMWKGDIDKILSLYKVKYDVRCRQ